MLDRLVLLHVPKTGGTSLSNWLYEVYEPGEIVTDFRHLKTNALGHVLRSEMEWFVRTMSAEQLEKCKIFSGHLPFGFDAALNLDFSYVSFFRNPLDRLLSGFLYGSSDTLSTEDEKGLVFGLHRSLSVGGSPGFDNPLTRILTGSDVLAPLNGMTVWEIPPLTREDRRLALRNLYSRFEFVGLTEHFDDSCKILFALLGKEYRKAGRKLNETPLSVRRSVIPQATLRLLEHRVRHDMILYAAACELYNERAREFGLAAAQPYPVNTLEGGPISSGDYSPWTSADDAFGTAMDGVWLSFPYYRSKIGEYLGFDFAHGLKCTSVAIQLASSSSSNPLGFSLEASDDDFCRDVRKIDLLLVPADRKLHTIPVAEHDVVARSWRVRKLPDDSEPLAIAALSFDGRDIGKRNMPQVLENLERVTKNFRGVGDEDTMLLPADWLTA